MVHAEADHGSAAVDRRDIIHIKIDRNGPDLADGRGAFDQHF